MKKSILFILLFALFAFNVFAQTNSTHIPKDIQWWNEVQLIIPLRQTQEKKGKLTDKITLNLNAVARIGRDVSFPVDNRLSATIDFRVNKFLKISPGYLYQQFEQFPHRKSIESRLTLAGNIEKRFDFLTFRHRSMFEYKFRNSRADTQVYRTRFQVSSPLKIKHKEIFSPFVSEEGYYDFQLRKWNRSEFFAGITRKLTKKFSLDVFYIKTDSLPVNVNGIGTTLKIKLR